MKPPNSPLLSVVLSTGLGCGSLGGNELGAVGTPAEAIMNSANTTEGSESLGKLRIIDRARDIRGAYVRLLVDCILSAPAPHPEFSGPMTYYHGAAWQEESRSFKYQQDEIAYQINAHRIHESGVLRYRLLIIRGALGGGDDFVDAEGNGEPQIVGPTLALRSANSQETDDYRDSLMSSFGACQETSGITGNVHIVLVH